MHRKLTTAFKATREHFRHWSPIHFAFDAFLTAVITWLAHKLGQLNWYEVFFVAFLIFGTVTSGIAVYRKERETYTKAMSSPRGRRRKELPTVVSALQEAVTAARKIKTVGEFHKWQSGVATKLEAMGNGSQFPRDADNFLACVPDEAPDPFDTPDVDWMVRSSVNYLEGMIAREVTRSQRALAGTGNARQPASKSD